MGDRGAVPYVLGIDFGTTFTAAAIVRDGQARVADLGTKSSVVPSVLFLGVDDVVLAGDAAARRAASDPARVAREFKRRVGDPAPILLGRLAVVPEALVARLLRWTVDAVTEREGGRPERIAISHPANWGPYKQDLLGEAIRLAELDVSMLLTEPEAAAIAYAATERVDIGSVVAVYDLGGGTFDAAVLRKTAGGFEILGEPEGVDRLGGVDFDAAVFGFVTAALGGAIEGLDPSEPATIAALAHLRAECVAAKEALSSDTETSVAVLLPGLHTEVRLTRAELEAMLRPPLSDTIAAMHRALRNADVTPDDVDVVLLVGGSSRIPLVADLVSNEFGRPVAVDAHPKHVVATGAALAVAAVTEASPAAEQPVVVSEPIVAEPEPVPDAGAGAGAGTGTGTGTVRRGAGVPAAGGGARAAARPRARACCVPGAGGRAGARWRLADRGDTWSPPVQDSPSSRC